MPMPSAEWHSWVHGKSWNGVPGFSLPGRVLYGSPDWAKEALYSAGGHLGDAAGPGDQSTDDNTDDSDFPGGDDDED